MIKLLNVANLPTCVIDDAKDKRLVATAHDNIAVLISVSESPIVIHREEAITFANFILNSLGGEHE